MLCWLLRLFLVSNLGSGFSVVGFHSHSLGLFHFPLFPLVYVWAVSILKVWSFLSRALWFFAGMYALFVLVYFVTFLPLSRLLCFRCFRYVSSSFGVTLAFRWLFFFWPAFLVLCVDDWSHSFLFEKLFYLRFYFLPFSDPSFSWPRHSIVRWGKLVFVLDLLYAQDLYWVSVTMIFSFLCDWGFRFRFCVVF